MEDGHDLKSRPELRVSGPHFRRNLGVEVMRSPGSDRREAEVA